MTGDGDAERKWPAVPLIPTERLTLDPLHEEDSQVLAELLYDPRLYTFTGGLPESMERLREGFVRMAAGHSPDRSQGWLNWVVRTRTTREIVGWLQATLTLDKVVEVAWVVASAYQGRGYAGESSGAVVRWLVDEDASVTIIAHIHPDNLASIGVARTLGMNATTTVVDGEVRWEA